MRKEIGRIQHNRENKNQYFVPTNYIYGRRAQPNEQNNNRETSFRRIPLNTKSASYIQSQNCEKILSARNQSGGTTACSDLEQIIQGLETEKKDLLYRELLQGTLYSNEFFKHYKEKILPELVAWVAARIQEGKRESIFGIEPDVFAELVATWIDIREGENVQEIIYVLRYATLEQRYQLYKDQEKREKLEEFLQEQGKHDVYKGIFYDCKIIEESCNYNTEDKEDAEEIDRFIKEIQTIPEAMFVGCVISCFKSKVPEIRNTIKDILQYATRKQMYQLLSNTFMKDWVSKFLQENKESDPCIADLYKNIFRISWSLRDNEKMKGFTEREWIGSRYGYRIAEGFYTLMEVTGETLVEEKKEIHTEARNTWKNMIENETENWKEGIPFSSERIYGYYYESGLRINKNQLLQAKDKAMQEYLYCLMLQGYGNEIYQKLNPQNCTLYKTAIEDMNDRSEILEEIVEHSASEWRHKNIIYSALIDVQETEDMKEEAWICDQRIFAACFAAFLGDSKSAGHIYEAFPNMCETFLNMLKKYNSHIETAS